MVPALPVASWVQGQMLVAGAEYDAVTGDVQLVLGPPVVKAGLDLGDEVHRTAHHLDLADQPMAVGRLPARDGHEVGHLADPVLGQEPRDQHRRVREVQLTGYVLVSGRGYPHIAALVGVQQASEDTRGVEPGEANPVTLPARRTSPPGLHAT